MVILVPKILPPHLVPLGLGLHKSMEMASSSLSQTLAGLWLDRAKPDSAVGPDAETDLKSAGRSLIVIWWLVNVCQLACAFWLYRIEGKRRAAVEKQLVKEEYERLPLSDVSDDSLVDEGDRHGEVGGSYFPPDPTPPTTTNETRDTPTGMSGLAQSEAEKWRSKIALCGCLGWIALVWTVFLGTAWSRL